MWRATILIGLMTVLTTAAGCRVNNATDPTTGRAPSPPPAPAGGTTDGGIPAPAAAGCESKDACVAQCKATVGDEASRQPCYDNCMRACR